MFLNFSNIYFFLNIFRFDLKILFRELSPKLLLLLFELLSKIKIEEQILLLLHPIIIFVIPFCDHRIERDARLSHVSAMQGESNRNRGILCLLREVLNYTAGNG